MIFNKSRQPDFFNLSCLLLFLRFLFFFLKLIFIFAIIQYFSHRRICLRRYAYQIQLFLLRQSQSFISAMTALWTKVASFIPDLITALIIVLLGFVVARIVDAVLTFEELTNWLDDEGIVLDQEMDHNPESRARFFPTTGGILKTMAQKPESGYTYMALDGVENCIAALRDIESGKVHKCFIEMSACVGSCIGGPVMEKYHRNPVMDYMKVASYAGSKDFDVAQPDSLLLKKTFEPIERKNRMPSEDEIADILKKMGKTKPEDELNCGSCGYNTCREKAIAIFHGKAEISMCLPYLKEKAESFSDCIVSNTPNGLIVVNESLEVQQINAAARKIMNIRSASDVLGDQLIRILDPTPFLKVLESKRSIRDQRIYLAEYKKYVEQTIVYDTTYQLLICIMRDVTDEEDEREKKESISRQTVEIADKVVDKQMRIVQEIASLLGETAAETKIALTKLKESITNE